MGNTPTWGYKFFFISSTGSGEIARTDYGNF
jgi:hypothetical protein